jgi:hypothetical protein
MHLCKELVVWLGSGPVRKQEGGAVCSGDVVKLEGGAWNVEEQEYLRTIE